MKMANDHPSVKRPSLKEIKSIFPNANAVGMILPEMGKGLMIAFNTRADLCHELSIDNPSLIVRHEDLFRLTKNFGFVVLKNCSAARLPDNDASTLSHGKDSDGKFIQDPFHYDVAPSDHPLQILKGGYMTGIYKSTAEARQEDTVYATEADVKEAIAKLYQDHLNDEVRKALGDMMKPDYHFRLYHPDETSARHVIRQQYPEFVDDVFHLIPKERKYRQRWLKDQWDIFIFSNVFGDCLHARPTGHSMMNDEAPSNSLRGLYLLG